MSTASRAYSSGRASRCGNGTPAARPGPHLVGDRGEHGGLDDARRDGHDADAVLGEVAGGREGETDDAALARAVGGLADLAVVGGDARGVDDDTPLAVGVGFGRGHGLGGEGHHDERADEVDLDDLAVQVDRVRPLATEDAGRRTDARTADDDAQRALGVGGGLLDGDPDVGLGGDVGGEVLDPVDLRRPLAGVEQVEGEHAGAGRGQGGGGGRAQAGGAPGDDGGGVGDLHALILPCPGLRVPSRGVGGRAVPWGPWSCASVDTSTRRTPSPRRWPARPG